MRNHPQNHRLPLLLGSVLLALLTTPRASAQQREPLRDGWEIAVESAAGQRPGEDRWKPCPVPSTFEAVLGDEFDGVAWLRCRIDRPAAAGGPTRDRMEFRAAATEATVFWNGEERGRHLGGWTPFTVDLPSAADGSLRGLLELRLDEKSGHDTQGFLTIIQPHFGGVWQDVVLHRDAGPTFDEQGLYCFGLGSRSWLIGEVPVRRRPEDGRLEVEILLSRDGRPLAQSFVSLSEVGSLQFEIPVDEPERWSPRSPILHDVEFRLRRVGTDAVLHTVRRRVGFREVGRDGTRLLWNGQPLQVRGMLHWGYSPPGFAPPADPERWRRDLERMKSLGCNLVKCCLWVPPRAYYDVADELGMLVWQEYPTWHAQLVLDHLPPLRAEFAEFFRHDRGSTSVALRSITCETGADVHTEVLQSLYDDAHAAVPNSLVIDNSSWISWMRIHDFWDDHPYGNNGWWPGKLREMNEFIAEREAMPLLLGECIASDTWFDRPAWEAVHGTESRWFQPWCLENQRLFEQRLSERWGPELVEQLLPVSRRYALRNRKYQCERIRLDSPDAGYVLSVWRDFPKARMGFLDDLERMKWTPEEWSWHRDTMLCLDTADDARAFVLDGEIELPVRVSHYGPSPREGRLELVLEDGDRRIPVGAELRATPGQVHEGLTLRAELPAGAAPRRARLSARWTDGETVLAASDWELWLLPPLAPPVVHARGVTPADGGPALRVVEALDPALLDELERGGHALLRANPGKGSFKTSGLWYLKGAPWAPPHPLFVDVPRELLFDLQGFDLEQPFVVHGERLLDEVAPILAFWDNHDVHHFNDWLMAFECRVGEGRLLVSALDPATPAGAWLEARFLHHLQSGPAPAEQLRPEVVDGLRKNLAAQPVPLSQWRFRVDTEDRGRELGWKDGLDTGEGWRDMPAGRHWEAEGVHHDGVAWYATTFTAPESWRGQEVHAVFEGVDDSYHLYCNGELVARHGDPETGETVWLVRTVGRLDEVLEYGAVNRLVLRVVDHVGAGGMHREAFLTTGSVDPDAGSELLN